jgi:CHAT domain-containing protein
VIGIAVVAGCLAVVERGPLGDAYRRLRLPHRLAGTQTRTLTGRIDALPYAPLGEKAQRGGSRTSSADSMPVHRARVLLEPSRDPHLVATGMLLGGRTDASIAELRKAAANGDPRALSDLAAALLAQAEELDAYTPALDAIVAARRAIEKSPHMPAAHFNLALALEYIGLVREAREEFRAAAALEPESPWAREALERAAVRDHVPPTWEAVRHELDAARDEPTRKFIIRENLEIARVRGEGFLLDEWAKARLAGDAVAARRTLDVVRVIGAVALETLSDRFLADVVAGIDAAEAGGEASARRIAVVVKRYCDGRIARANGEQEAGDRLLAAAVRDLAAVNSPLQYLARYHVAGTLYERSMIDEALREIAWLEGARLDRRGYRTLHAQLGWVRGVCRLVRGSYAEALEDFDRSRATSASLGDDARAADFDGLAAEALEYLGDGRDAWARRARALRVYSSYPGSRTSVVLAAAANLQIAGRNWDRAEALLDYAIRASLGARKNDVVATHAFAQRAFARYEIGRREEAESDRGRASIRVAHIHSEAVRKRLQAEIDIATSAAKRSSSPRDAIAYLNKSIAVLAATGQSVALPRLYAERARAWESVGDVARRREDLRAGLAVIDRWEASIADIEQRAAVSVWSEAMRRDLIGLELDAGDVAAAFAYSDDRYTSPAVSAPLALREIQRRLAPASAVLEYARTRDRTIVFIIRADSSRAATLPASATSIAAAAKAMRDAGDARFPAAAASLHDLVLAPIRRHLSGISTIAFVPDRDLSAVPFGALLDRAGNAYLIESTAIVQSRSATAAITLSERTNGRGVGRVVAIGASDFDRELHPDAAPLPGVEKEARNIGRTYVDAQTLLGANATPDAVERSLSAASVIHYAGHIVDRGADARLLLSPSRGRDSLTARDIGALTIDRARVAILAACRGSVSSEPTAVVQDMASGFLEAGVPTVIASTTDVADDKAPLTMQSLHKFLRAGADPAEALRQTAVRERSQGQEIPLSIRFLVMGGSRLLVR